MVFEQFEMNFNGYLAIIKVGFQRSSEIASKIDLCKYHVLSFKLFLHGNRSLTQVRSS
jgi:hypothetical protein